MHIELDEIISPKEYFDIKIVGKCHSEEALKENPRWIATNFDICEAKCSICNEMIKYADGFRQSNSLTSHIKKHLVEAIRKDVKRILKPKK